MHALKTFLSAAAIFAAAFPVASQAESINLFRSATDATFYPGGYSGAADTTIWYYSAADASTIGPSVWMRSADGVGNPGRISGSTSGSGSRRFLLRFDLSGMTGQGVTVTSDATVTLTYSADGTNGTGTLGLYQIAAANAGWTESTNNLALNPSGAALTNKSNQGDPTWWYKSIDNATYAATTGFKTSNVDDTTSVKWASQQVNQGLNGSNPEGYAQTGGLWNPIDLVDQNPATVVDPDPTKSYLSMSNMDPVAATDINPGTGANTQFTFTIPQAMIQSWIDSPADNAGLLGRFVSFSGISPVVYANLWSSEAADTLFRPALSFDFTQSQSLQGDFNGDNSVDSVDLTIWQQQYGTTLDGADFLTWQRNLGQSVAVAAAASVPEPSALAMALCLGAVALTGARSRRRASNL